MTAEDLKIAARTLYGEKAAQKKLAAALNSDVASVRRWWSGKTPVPGPVAAAVEAWLSLGLS
jgi:hypothetical protein